MSFSIECDANDIDLYVIRCCLGMATIDLGGLKSCVMQVRSKSRLRNKIASSIYSPPAFRNWTNIKVELKDKEAVLHHAGGGSLRSIHIHYDKIKSIRNNNQAYELVAASVSHSDDELIQFKACENECVAPWIAFMLYKSSYKQSSEIRNRVSKVVESLRKLQVKCIKAYKNLDFYPRVEVATSSFRSSSSSNDVSMSSASTMDSQTWVSSISPLSPRSDASSMVFGEKFYKPRRGQGYTVCDVAFDSDVFTMFSLFTMKNESLQKLYKHPIEIASWDPDFAVGAKRTITMKDSEIDKTYEYVLKQLVPNRGYQVEIRATRMFMGKLYTRSTNHFFIADNDRKCRLVVKLNIEYVQSSTFSQWLQRAHFSNALRKMTSIYNNEINIELEKMIAPPVAPAAPVEGSPASSEAVTFEVPQKNASSMKFSASNHFSGNKHWLVEIFFALCVLVGMYDCYRTVLLRGNYVDLLERFDLLIQQVE